MCGSLMKHKVGYSAVAKSVQGRGQPEKPRGNWCNGFWPLRNYSLTLHYIFVLLLFSTSAASVNKPCLCCCLVEGSLLQWRFYVGAGGAIAPPVFGFAPPVWYATKAVTVNNITLLYRSIGNSAIRLKRTSGQRIQ